MKRWLLCALLLSACSTSSPPEPKTLATAPSPVISAPDFSSGFLWATGSKDLGAVLKALSARSQRCANTNAWVGDHYEWNVVTCTKSTGPSRTIHVALRPLGETWKVLAPRTLHACPGPTCHQESFLRPREVRLPDRVSLRWTWRTWKRSQREEIVKEGEHESATGHTFEETQTTDVDVLYDPTGPGLFQVPRNTQTMSYGIWGGHSERGDQEDAEAYLGVTKTQRAPLRGSGTLERTQATYQDGAVTLTATRMNIVSGSLLRADEIEPRTIAWTPLSW